MEFIRQFQSFALPIAVGLIIVLGIMVFALIVIYLASNYRHRREIAYVRRNQHYWQNLIVQLVLDLKTPDEVVISRRERSYFRNLLVSGFFDHQVDILWDKDSLDKDFDRLKGLGNIKDKLRTVYRSLGFVDDDLKDLSDRRWWHRLKAMERLEDMGLADAEEQVFPLLDHSRKEIRFGALRNLASVGTQRFIKEIPGVFSKSSTWSYLYLVNILLDTNIPMDILVDMAHSDNQYKRKASAILLGRKKDKKAITTLARLASDEVSEVRREAIASLGHIGSAAAIPIFWRKIKDESAQVRAAIAKSMGDMDQLYLLQRLAGDPEFEVRFQAFASLKKLGFLGKQVIENYRGEYKSLAQEFLTGVGHA